MEIYQKSREDEIQEQDLGRFIANFKQFDKKKRRNQIYLDSTHPKQISRTEILFMSRLSLIKFIFNKTKRTISRNIRQAYFEMLSDKTYQNLVNDALSLMDEE
ncbi:hypothetical protein NEF87_000620 [Candidatus Lokiarchaeum ossiferum]|uniref:Uncharacterized protein n=1 Tax=Candidatus Lokiarchaeum ossiferum TaxID=2951803 RepID=A0ABY6HLF7_9ARCH|nr:hypothetical protein NEF87_000620 [Candidatus Lokiarchaeum sp. B-35]